MRASPKLIGMLALVCALASHAQLTTPRLACSLAVLGEPFEVMFQGDVADLFFKGETHRLGFHRAWRSQEGEPWADYRDDKLVLTTNWPSDKYASVAKIGSMHSLASCDLQTSP